MEHSIESWKKPFFVDIALLKLEFLSNPEQHVDTFLKTKNQSPEYWRILNNDLSALGLHTDEINLRLHNIFLATLVQQRRTQIEELYCLIDYHPSEEIKILLGQMNQLDTENQTVS